jgi:hypothetical protein
MPGKEKAALVETIEENAEIAGEFVEENEEVGAVPRSSAMRRAARRFSTVKACSRAKRKTASRRASADFLPVATRPLV